MKTFITIVAVILLGIFMSASSFAACEANAFIEAVNAAWVSTNHALLEQTLTDQVAECNNDVLAKGLLYVYYQVVEPNITNAKNAAAAYIDAVSNRMPSEVIHKRIPTDIPLRISQMNIFTNSSTNMLTPSERIEHLHYWDADEFPYFKLFQLQMKRIEGLESGELTEDDVAPFNKE